MKIISLGGTVLMAIGCAAAPDPQILEASQQYGSYGRVDETRRWAPTDCRPPMPNPPRICSSRDPATHGRKLYYLFAKDRAAYLHTRELPQPVGQVIVKEAWTTADHSTQNHPVTGDRGPLFMMIKTGQSESDEGWIYATVAPDGKTVTASGRIASCMECHQAAKHDRLFGLKSCASPE